MDRRTLLKLIATSSLLAAGIPSPSSANVVSTPAGLAKRRVRAGDSDWPSRG